MTCWKNRPFKRGANDRIENRVVGGQINDTIGDETRAVTGGAVRETTVSKFNAGSRMAWAWIGLVGTGLPISSFADDQDVRDYRSYIMKSMGEQVAALDQVAKGQAPAGDVVAHTEALSITARLARVAFTPKVPGGESKPEVWGKWDDFSRRLDEMVAATADLAKAARQGGVTAVTPKLNGLSCKSCHDEYLVPKK
jgi:cytochrome c556